MRACVLVVTDDQPPDAVSETLETLDGTFSETTVVCPSGQRDAVSDVSDGRATRVVETVSDGGVVAALRTGFRATKATRAFVTTPSMPAVDAESVTQLAPAPGHDATLAVINGTEKPPLGGYVTETAAAACDTTLATGSRRLSNVFARLSVTAAVVERPARTNGGNSTKATCDD